MSQKIYIGNLSSNIVNEALAEKFSKYGIVYSAKIITDQETNRPTGMAFVEMASSEEADMAIMDLNGTFFEGRLINVGKTPKPYNSN